MSAISQGAGRILEMPRGKQPRQVPLTLFPSPGFQSWSRSWTALGVLLLTEPPKLPRCSLAKKRGTPAPPRAASIRSEHPLGSQISPEPALPHVHNSRRRVDTHVGTTLSQGLSS